MPSSGCQCMGYAALCGVALLGFATILVMILIPDVRANLSFRPTNCTVFNSGKQFINDSNQVLERAFLDVSFLRDDNILVNGTAYTTLDAEFTTENQTQFLLDYPINHSYDCFYDPTNSTRVIMRLEYRALTISMVAIAGGFMLLIPMLVCISTYVQGNRADSYAPIKFEPV